MCNNFKISGNGNTELQNKLVVKSSSGTFARFYIVDKDIAEFNKTNSHYPINKNNILDLTFNELKCITYWKNTDVSAEYDPIRYSKIQFAGTQQRGEQTLSQANVQGYSTVSLQTNARTHLNLNEKKRSDDRGLILYKRNMSTKGNNNMAENNNIKKHDLSPQLVRTGQFHAKYTPKDNKFKPTSKGWHKFYLFRNSMQNHMTKVARVTGFVELRDYEDAHSMTAKGFVAFLGMCVLSPFVLAGGAIGFVTGIFDGLYRMIKRSTTTQKTATEINTNLQKLQKEINDDSYNSDTDKESLSCKVLSKYEKKSHILNLFCILLFCKSTASGNLHKDLKNDNLTEPMKLQKIQKYKLSTNSSGIHRNMGKGMDDSINEAMEEHYNPISFDI